MSREARLDDHRRREAVLRAHQAYRVHAGDGLTLKHPRVVLAHTQSWFVQRLASQLDHYGVVVRARAETGADAIGACIALQPEVLFLEERLPVMRSLDVAAEAALFAPDTRVVVQVRRRAVDEWREQDAVSIVDYRAPAAEVAARLVELAGVTTPASLR
jgi:DNA-binding NarL/FixJ family response regulator